MQILHSPQDISGKSHDHTDVIYNQSKASIVEAAAKGVIMLQETYDQNITEYSKGHLRLKSGIKRNTSSIDSIKLDDTTSMSTMFDNQRYCVDLKKLLEYSSKFGGFSLKIWHILP